MELNKIYNIDCIDGLKQLEDESVDLVLTSPPYDELRSYNGYKFNFEGTAKELFRVIKKGGIVVWIIGDATIEGSETGTSFKQALSFKEKGFNLYDTMIWIKPDPIPLTHNRYEQSFEYMFIFSKGKPKTFNPIKVPTKYGGKTENMKTWSLKDSKQAKRIRDETITRNYERIKHNNWVISVNDGNKLNHPAKFPEQLAQDHILSWSNENDIVLDPLCGSGTTCKMALLNKRKFIGFDISKDYCTIAEQRIKETENRLKVIENQGQL